MKPHRMKMTHELVSAYGMLEKMEILVLFLYHKLSFQQSSYHCRGPLGAHLKL